MRYDESSLREALSNLPGESPREAREKIVDAVFEGARLRNIYERLGIGSRAELARLMAEDS